jgi:hypothetical protein
MKRTKNKIATIRLKKNRIKNINKLNQSVVIHLAKSSQRKSNTHNLRTTNAPIIRHYYAPIPQPSQESFQTNKTLESVGNTLRELKAEQTILRNELNREERNPIMNSPILPTKATEREREDNDINRGITPLKPAVTAKAKKNDQLTEKSRAIINQLQPNRRNFPSSEQGGQVLIQKLRKRNPI